MSRRTTVAVCLALGLLATPGVALADSPWPAPDVPGGWSEQTPRGDVCEEEDRQERGDPPCHTTTDVSPTTTSAGTSTQATTTTTDVAGTSATSATTTTTDVAGTSATATTSGVLGTSAAVVPKAPPRSERPALARTGATPLWVGVGGLALLLSGAGLLLVSRRRRA
ncbi:LPXTG cell wall anchor domain-containing protein [Saccharothrix sp. HUAS TT1]|uniref:LPXTG cell wall anchor domain-containing protein n=1 Tax=unclassified Saccharothrix TaxID=2593673 RepID=UPI00345C35BD